MGEIATLEEHLSDIAWERAIRIQPMGPAAPDWGPIYERILIALKEEIALVSEDFT